MSPSAFKAVFQSLKRLEAHDRITELYIQNQACNGTGESIKSFTENLSVWLPVEKHVSTDKSSLISFLSKKGKK